MEENAGRTLTNEQKTTMDSRIIGGRQGNKFLLAEAIDRLINTLVTTVVSDENTATHNTW